MESPNAYTTNWNSLAFAAALILNRLRCEQQKRDSAENEDRREEQTSDYQQGQQVSDDAA